jgi:5-methyltetrahydropteroyltriglutamate--homocysteine methyltransferase
VLRGLPASLTVAMHLCRGNRGGKWHAEGSYETVADRLFNQIDVSAFFLEYDTPRAGNFTPLRLVPKDKMIVLGLVSTKSEELEDKDMLKRRIEEATKYVALDKLGISPQCGFASVETGNPISPAVQEAKLRRVVEVAQEVWG